MNGTVKRGMQIGAILTMFGGGYLCGALSGRQVIAADMKDLGGAVGGTVAKEAAGQGPTAQAAKLDAVITDMQRQVDALQKNIETLKTIKAALAS